MTETDRLSEFREAYKASIQAWSPWLKEAKKDLSFFAGDQWEAKEMAYLKRAGREALVFNKVRRIVNVITGFQRKHRLSVKVDAIAMAPGRLTDLEIKTAAQLSAVLQAELSKAYGGYVILSQAFAGALKTGLNLVEVYLDHTEDLVSGDLRFGRLPYNEFLLDPNLVKTDLGDCRYILRRKWVTKDEAISLLKLTGQEAKEVRGLNPAGVDEKFPYFRPQKGLDGKPLLRYDEFWTRTFKPVKVLLHKETGMVLPFPGGRRKLQEFLSLQDENGVFYRDLFEVVTTQQPTVELSVFLEERMFYTGSDPLGIDDYPFVPIWGFWDPEHDKFEEKLQGVIRALRDPQTEINKRRSKILDIIDSAAVNRLKLKEGALVNPEQAYQSGHNLPLWIKENKSMDDVQAMPNSDVPAGLFQILGVLDNDILEAGNVTDELLGNPASDDVQIAGILAKLRQAAGLTVLQELFDNYRESKKLLGHKLVKAVQENYEPAKIAEIINETPTPLLYERSFPKYGISIGEGLLTDSQRQMYHLQLMQYKQMGAPIPWSEIIDTAPFEGAERLKEAVRREEEAQAQAQAAQAQQARTMNELAIAEAEARLAQAKENLADAFLKRVKGLVEIEQLKAKIQAMDADRLVKLLQAGLDMEDQVLSRPRRQPETPPITKR